MFTPSLDKALKHFHRAHAEIDAVIEHHQTQGQEKSNQVGELHKQIMEHDAEKNRAMKVKENLKNLLAL